MKDRSYRRKTWLLIGITVVLALILALLVVLAIFGKGGKKVDASRQENLPDVSSAVVGEINPKTEDNGQSTNLSVWEGYWYFFYAENVYCTEYQFHEDGTYEKRERYTATGKYKNRTQTGEYVETYLEDGTYQLQLDGGTGSWWRLEESIDKLWSRTTTSWGTRTTSVMIHYADVPEVSQLSEGYDTFMSWIESDVYEYSEVTSDVCMKYAYPYVFHEIAEGDTYADGTAMEPLNILRFQGNSWGYRSEDGTQALFYHLFNVYDYEPEKIVQLIEQEYNLGKGSYMEESESYWDVDGFRLLLNINGRWHFICAAICEISEGNSEMALMEFSFTGESYWPWNPTIAHLEYNLQCFEVTD